MTTAPNILALNDKLISFGYWEKIESLFETETHYFLDIQIYDSMNENKGWQSVGTSDNACGWVSMAVIGNKAIFFKGKRLDRDNIVSSSSDICTYDDNTKDFKKHTHTTEARNLASVAVVGNKVIFFGGWKDDSVPSSVIDIYDNNTSQWTKVQGYTPQARVTALVAVVGNKAVFFGGRNSKDNVTSAIDIYDGDTGIWETVKQEGYNPQARIWGSAAVVGSKAIFFGGKLSADNYHDYSSAIDIYDDDTGRWKTSDHQIEARAIAATAVIGNKAIFFGGWTGYEHSRNVDIYDAENDTWTGFKMEGPALKIQEDGFAVIVKGPKAIFIAVDKNRMARKYEIEILGL